MSRPNAGDGAPDPAFVARFRADLEALTGGPPAPDRRLGVAVSGGGDSLALLVLAATAYPGAVAAASVDHGLRPEAAGEAAMVGRACAALGVPHAVLRRPEGFALAGNVQDAARRLRYGLLAGWAADSAAAWIATAHHRDDLAETLLMRARRGAGVGGLAAMAARRPIAAGPGAAVLVRPLLGWSRAELAGVTAAAGLAAAADPSNADMRFERARVRALFAAVPELASAGLALAARNLRDAEEALVWVAEREWEARHAAEGEAVLLDAAGLPHELRRRLVARAIGLAARLTRADSGLRGSALDRVVRLLEAGRPATLAGVRARPGARWRFEPAPPRRTG